MDELQAKVALTVARKFTPAALAALYAKFRSAAAIVGAPAEQVLNTPGVNREAPDALAEVIRTGEHQREIDKIDRR